MGIYHSHDLYNSYRYGNSSHLRVLIYSRNISQKVNFLIWSVAEAGFYECGQGK